MKKLLTIFAVLALLGLTTAAMAESDTTTHDVNLNVDEMAVLDVTDPATDVTMTLLAPDDGGEAIADVLNSEKWLNYTSVVPDGETRDITAEVAGADAAPAGTKLDVEVLSIDGGTNAGNVVVGGGNLVTGDTVATAVTIVTGIGSCETGTGVDCGANVQFTFGVDNIDDVVSDDDQTVTVTYTLTESS